MVQINWINLITWVGQLFFNYGIGLAGLAWFLKNRPKIKVVKK